MDNNIVQQELAATAESQKLAIYKSIYYQMNAKPDSLSKAYARKVIINKDDLIDLNNRINDRIRLNYEQDGYIASVTVNLKDKHVITFKCWEEFLQHKWIENSSTVSIVLQWNFNIRVPGYEQPQNHNLVVKLTNGLRPEEMLNLIFSGKIEDFEEVELNTFPVVARVDFIQVVLGEELLNIVGEWVKGLRQNNDLKNPIISLMKKYRKRVAQYFEYISLIMTCILAIGINVRYINQLNVVALGEITLVQFKNLLVYLFISGMLIYFLRRLFEKLAENIYDKLSQYGQVFIFNITRGDINLQDKIKNRDKSNGRGILVRFFLSLLFNVGCGMIASWLYSL